MNAEQEMNTSDGLGAAPDSLEVLAAECGYSEVEDCPVDSLIDYKNALEERLRARESTLELIASGVPTDHEWRSAAAYMEFVADVLDQGGILRPQWYGN